MFSNFCRIFILIFDWYKTLSAICLGGWVSFFNIRGHEEPAILVQFRVFWWSFGPRSCSWLQFAFWLSSCGTFKLHHALNKLIEVTVETWVIFFCSCFKCSGKKTILVAWTSDRYSKWSDQIRCKKTNSLKKYVDIIVFWEFGQLICSWDDLVQMWLILTGIRSFKFCWNFLPFAAACPMSK